MRISDWSSDVCSSDLALDRAIFRRGGDVAVETAAQRADRGAACADIRAGVGGAADRILAGEVEQERRGLERRQLRLQREARCCARRVAMVQTGAATVKLGAEILRLGLRAMSGQLQADEIGRAHV